MTELEEQTMRKQQFILGWLCTVLPFVSIGFGLIGAITKCNPPTWWYSISATFYTNSNVVLIGLLFATGIYFWAYEGYDKMDKNIVKPVTLIRQEFIDTLVDEINNCQLPMFVIEPILQDLLDQVRTAAQKQYESDKRQYEEQLKEVQE